MRLVFFALSLAIFAAFPDPVQADGIEEIDFKNFTYPWYPSGYKPPYRVREVRLDNGEYVVDRKGNVEDTLFSLANISYADLTGDGKKEAIVTLTAIFNPNGSYACIFIYSMRRNVPRVLWKHETGDRAYGGLRGIRVADKNLVVEQYDTGNEQPCMICAKGFVRSHYAWNGWSFRRTKVKRLPWDNGVSSWAIQAIPSRRVRPSALSNKRLQPTPR